MHSVNLSGYRMKIKFDKDPLAAEKSNYLTKIVNVYIVNDLNDWPKDPTNNFKFNNCLFGATNVVKNSDKEKYVCSGYGITFDSAAFWSFDNDTARNVIIFGVNNSSSSHSENRRSDFLILGKCPTFGINGSFGAPKKKFDINFSKANTRFCLSLHYNGDNIYLFVNGKEIFKFKVDKKIVNFPTRFCLGSISNGSSALESKEVSLSGIDESNVSNINNI